MLLSGLLAGLAVTAGAVIVLLIGQPSDRIMAIMLAMAAGVMAAVAGFDLLPAAVSLGSKWNAMVGFVAGGLLMQGMGGALSRLPMMHQRRMSQAGRTGYLVFAGVALHDVMEGMAIAVGYGAMNHLGVALVIAVGLHHIPEGMAMAAPLVVSGLSRGSILKLSLLTALMTPLGVLVGQGLGSLSMNVMGLLLAAAGGAMAALAFFELCPEAWGYHRSSGRVGFVLGVIGMLLVL